MQKNDNLDKKLTIGKNILENINVNTIKYYVRFTMFKQLYLHYVAAKNEKDQK